MSVCWVADGKLVLLYACQLPSVTRSIPSLLLALYQSFASSRFALLSVQFKGFISHAVTQGKQITSLIEWDGKAISGDYPGEHKYTRSCAQPFFIVPSVPPLALCGHTIPCPSPFILLLSLCIYQRHQYHPIPPHWATGR